MWDFQADRLVYPRSAKRFEYGTMAYGTALGAGEAINYLLDLGIDAIAAHNRAIAEELRLGLMGLGAHILSPADVRERSAIVAARFPGHDSRALTGALEEQGVVVSLRRDFIRFSPHLYNDSEDVQKAVSAAAHRFGPMSRTALPSATPRSDASVLGNGEVPCRRGLEEARRRVRDRSASPGRPANRKKARRHCCRPWPKPGHASGALAGWPAPAGFAWEAGAASR